MLARTYRHSEPIHTREGRTNSMRTATSSVQRRAALPSTQLRGGDTLQPWREIICTAPMVQALGLPQPPSPLEFRMHSRVQIYKLPIFDL